MTERHPQPNIPLLRKTWEKINELPSPHRVRVLYGMTFGAGSGSGAPVEDLALRLGVTEMWDQRDWWSKFTSITHRGCGTRGCFAGWAVQLSGADDYNQQSRVNVSSRAMTLLGLTYEEANALFYGQNDRATIKKVLEDIFARAGDRLE